METLIGVGIGFGLAIIVFLLSAKDFKRVVAFQRFQSSKKVREGFIKIDHARYFKRNPPKGGEERKQSIKKLERFKARNRFYR